MERALWVGIFGAVGVLSRYGIAVATAPFSSSPFPIGIMAINVLGAFLVGVFHVLGVEKGWLSHDLRLAVTVGFLGGFTTFSAYCMDAVRLFEDKRPVLALIYVFASVAGGLGATVAGMSLARRAFGAS